MTDTMTGLRRKNRTVPRWHGLSLHASWPELYANRLAVIFLLGALTFVGAFRAHAQTRRPGSATASSPVAATGLVVTGAVAQDLHLSFDDLKKCRASQSAQGITPAKCINTTACQSEPS